VTTTTAGNTGYHLLPPNLRGCNPDAAQLLTDFFEAKNSHDVDATMQFISPDLSVYADVTLAWELNGYDALREVWAQYMPTWGDGRSYPTAILGAVSKGDGSVVVHFTDTSELFGAEMRVAAAVDINRGKITRWADYWDSGNYSATKFGEHRLPDPEVPLALRSSAAVCAARLDETAARLATAVSVGDMNEVGRLMSYDATYEDRAVRVKIEGRSPVLRYLERSAPINPFGCGLDRGHTVGGPLGGAFEWARTDGHAVKNGITTVRLDREGSITHVVTTWDSRNLRDDDRRRLACLGIDSLED
jgi:ketosteroid isomerase-like protein